MKYHEVESNRNSRHSSAALRKGSKKGKKKKKKVVKLVSHERDITAQPNDDLDGMLSMANKLTEAEAAKKALIGVKHGSFEETKQQPRATRHERW